MKLFKKLLALTLVLCMVFCLSVAVLAADGDGTGDGSSSSTTPSVPTTDSSSFTITKVYKLTNEGTTSPAETFYITQEGEGKVTDGDATSAPDLPKVKVGEVEESYVGSVTFAEGAAKANATAESTDGSVGMITIGLPTYDKVGVYEYTLKETAGTTAGVTYREKTIKLVVSVINGTNGDIRIASVHAEEEGGSKTGVIENTYSAGSLSIKKEVTGNLGEDKRYFKFTLTLTGEEGKTYNTNGYAISGTTSYKDANDDGNPTSVTIGTPVEIFLRKDETITVSNLPYGVSYKIEEDADSAKGYTTKINGTASENRVIGADGKSKISDASTEVTFENNKVGEIDMGVSLDSLPYILALAVAFGGAVVMITRKRHVED